MSEDLAFEINRIIKRMEVACERNTANPIILAIQMMVCDEVRVLAIVVKKQEARNA